MREKILSVIVPSYNMEQYLPKCLCSLEVAPDLMERLEVLVVNDGSRDRTSEIAHEFATKWPGTYKVIDKQNGHYGSCVNVALKVVTGRFVKMLDADDSYDTDNFGTWLKFVCENIDSPEFAEVDCFVTDFCIVDSYGTMLDRRSYRIAQDRVIGLEDIPRHYAFAMHALAWKRDLLQRIHYRQTEGIAYTDTEWNMYPLVAVRKLYYSPIRVYRYLAGREGQSMAPAVLKKCVGQRIKMFMRMVKESNRESIPEEARYRLRFAIKIGMKAVLAQAFNSNAVDVDPFVAVIDDEIRKWGGIEAYDAFNSFLLLKAWRRRRHMTFIMKFLWRASTVFFGVVGVVRQFAKSCFNVIFRLRNRNMAYVRNV